MDDVLSIIREVAEQLEDPPEIPPDAMLRDEEMVDQTSQEPSRSEQFTEPAQPSARSPQEPYIPQWNLRQRQDLTTPELAARQPAAEGDVSPEVRRPQEVRVAQALTREPQQTPGVEVYEPLRVAGAMATAQLREQFQHSGAEFDRTSRVEFAQVTPEIRVSHMVPSDFPMDFQHALQMIDQNISLPNTEIDTNPPMLPEYAPLTPLDSSEQQVVDASYEDDSEERNIL